MIDILDLRTRINGLKQQVSQCIISLSTPVAKIAEIAVELFGEAHVDYTGQDYLMIHFPQLEITNSRHHRHTLYDMYVKLIIVNEAQRRNICIRGTRSSVTVDEFDSSYAHSHLESGSFKGSFREFCIGTGPFFDVTERVREYGTSDIDSWYLYLYNLRSYLCWESLEGGPYMRIESIRATSLSVPDVVNRLFPGIAQEIPTGCLYFNEGEVRIDFTSPLLLALYDKHFARLTNSEYIAEEKQRSYASRFSSLMFKGEHVMPRLLPSPIGNRAVRTPVNVINNLNARLAERINQFNKTFIHDTNKLLYSGRLGEIPVLQSSQTDHLQ